MILDQNLLLSPFGSTNPYQFYHVLNVEINASIPQIETEYKKLSLLYHPDRHDTDKDAWTVQFQILSTIKSTLTNIEERQKYNCQSRRAVQNAERECRSAAEAPPNGERDHAQEREAAPPPPPARTRCRAFNDTNQVVGGGQTGVSKLARSVGCFSNGQGPEEYAQDNCEVLASNGVLQNLPLLLKMITSAMSVDHQMDRLWTQNPHHIAHVFIQPQMK